MGRPASELEVRRRSRSVQPRHARSEPAPQRAGSTVRSLRSAAVAGWHLLVVGGSVTGVVGGVVLVVLGWRAWAGGPLAPPARAGQDPTGRADRAAAGFIQVPATDPPPARPRDPAGLGTVDPEKDRRIDEAIRRARASTVTLEYEAKAQRRVASGVVINDHGDILAIGIAPPADRSRPSVVAWDASGRRRPARWLAIDPDTGLTLLQADPAGLRPIRQAAGDPSLGADIFLIGNPYGLGHSVSRGHIAGFGRRFQVGPQELGGLIQIQASIHPGDSGALLADLDGGWLGLVRGTLAAPDNDVGFAIPTRDALWMADRLRATGKVDRAYLGLRFAADVAAGPGLPLADLGGEPAGAEVTAVVGGSPADRAGLRPGDRVTQVDDRPVGVAADLTDRLERTAAGADVAFDFYRGATRSRITVRATSRPPVAREAESPPLVAAMGGLAGPPAPAAAARPDEGVAPLLRSLREQLDRLERRVEQLERQGRERKSAANP